MSDEDAFDANLLPVLNSCGSYETFLDIMFSFLYRRTCFFKSIKDSDNEFSVGLQQGLAEQIVQMTFQKYQELETEKQHDIICEPIYLQASREEIVETTVTESQSSYEVTPASADDSIPLQHAEVQTVNNVPQELVSGKTSKRCYQEEESTGQADDRQKKDHHQGEKMYYASNPECYNGASYDTYCWSQTVSDLDVQIKVPSFVKCGKQVKVHISHTHLKAEILKDSEWEVLLDKDLHLRINNEGSTWTLDPGHHIHIHLEKPEERFWVALLEGEPKLNVSSIDCTKPYEDLPEEERAKIQELLYDENQRRLGKPTVKEAQVHEILKEAWDKENSPFRGQKLDLSNISIM